MPWTLVEETAGLALRLASRVHPSPEEGAGVEAAQITLEELRA